MPVETAADRAALFDEGDWAEAAVWTPAGGSATAVSVIVDQPHTVAEVAGFGTVAQAWRAYARASDMAAPARGDALVVGARTFAIAKAELDVLGVIWTLDLNLQ